MAIKSKMRYPLHLSIRNTCLKTVLALSKLTAYIKASAKSTFIRQTYLSITRT